MCSAEYEIEPGLDYEAVADALRTLAAIDVVDWGRLDDGKGCF